MAQRVPFSGREREMNQAVNRTTPGLGLTSAEAQLRLRQHGPNTLPETRPVPLWRRLIDQFRSPLIYILLFALGIDLTIWFVEGHSSWPMESSAIALILFLNAGLGVYQESKAENALARLKALAESFVWTIPVCSGNEGSYWDHGHIHRAHTPRGKFTVLRKIAGWRRSSLGLLYYPNYIVNGIAIHGSLVMRTYPDSHGCIRIPMYAAKELSEMTPVGTTVVVYD